MKIFVFCWHNYIHVKSFYFAEYVNHRGYICKNCGKKKVVFCDKDGMENFAKVDRDILEWMAE